MTLALRSMVGLGECEYGPAGICHICILARTLAGTAGMGVLSGGAVT